MGESRRRTWSVKEEGPKCVKIYEHFFYATTTPYKGVNITGKNYSFLGRWM